MRLSDTDTTTVRNHSKERRRNVVFSTANTSYSNGHLDRNRMAARECPGFAQGLAL